MNYALNDPIRSFLVNQARIASDLRDESPEEYFEHRQVTLDYLDAGPAFHAHCKRSFDDLVDEVANWDELTADDPPWRIDPERDVPGVDFDYARLLAQRKLNLELDRVLYYALVGHEVTKATS
jgi:hypothetical protein